MASSGVIAKRYFDAVQHRELDAALALWKPGAVERHGAGGDLIAPDDLREHFEELWSAFPDFEFEVLDTTTQKERCAVRWRATGTFLGPGRYLGYLPTAARLSVEGCDVLQIVEDQIVASDSYIDESEIVRQLGLAPASDSGVARRQAALTNARTWVNNTLYGAEPEAIAAGVWILRGGVGRRMNVYLIEDQGGVTVFDAGVRQMGTAIRAAGVKLGGIKRVVLGHADCDHRGGAAGIDAPIYCHPLEKSAAQSSSPYRDYWNFSLLRSWVRPIYPRVMASWDGGALEVAGTVQEGDSIAGFEVIELPGHAPGLIGLYRREDGLALVSDCFYTLNVETGLGAAATVPHPAFNYDTDQARESIRRLAALQPKVLWAGHTKPVTGSDVELQLQRAASAAV